MITHLENDPDQLIKAVMKFSNFRPSQKHQEIKRLMEIIKEKNLEKICEIGNFKGGSLILISQSAPNDAKLISIDINYPIERRILNKKLVKPGQLFFGIKGDTQGLETI